MTSDRPMPISPMPLEDFTDAMRAATGPDTSPVGLALTGLIGKAGPAISDVFFPFYSVLTKEPNVLGVKLTELVRLAIATTTGCEACLGFRDPRAVELGMDPNAPDLFDELEAAYFTPRERSAIRYALVFCTNHHLVDEAMWGELRSLFNDQEIMTLCLFVSTFLGTSRLSHAIRLVDAHCTLPGYRLAAITGAGVAPQSDAEGR